MKMIVRLSTIAAFILLGTGCARRKYVAQTVAPLDQRSRTSNSEQKAQDKSVTEPIKKVEEPAPIAVQTEPPSKAFEARVTAAAEAARKTGAAAKADSAKTETDALARVVDAMNSYQVLKSEIVLFPVNQATLTDDAKSQLQVLAKSAQGLEHYAIEIQGFTDKTGSPTVNESLSQQRAQEVARYLANEYKIPVRSISLVGSGYAQPVADDKTNEGRKLNRRVEVRLYVPAAANDSSLVHVKPSRGIGADGLYRFRTTMQSPAGSSNERGQQKPFTKATLPATEEVDEAIASLPPGRITYDPPGQMTVGLTISVQVRIIGLTAETPAEVSRVEPLLKNNMERPALPIRPLRVSQSMRIVLSGNADEFKIDHDSKYSPEIQAIGTEDTTEWTWTVTPLKSGKRRLHLSAVAIFNVSGKELQKNYAAYDTDIDVRVDKVSVVMGVMHFIVDQWKTITGIATATGITASITAWFRKRRGEPGAPDQAPAP